VLEKILAEMPAQLSELQTTITRQARAGGSGGGGHTKAASQPLPIDLRAAHLADLARNGLVSDIRHLCESRGLRVPQIKDAGRPVPTADLARWLHGHIEAIRQDQLAGEILSGLKDLQHALANAVDNHGKRYAGPCTAMVMVAVTVSDGTVKAELLAEPRVCDQPLFSRPGASTIRCNARDEDTNELLGCGKEYPASERVQWALDQAQDDMARPAVIASALRNAGYHVTEGQIRLMAKRQKLFAWREDAEGKPLYRVGDVLDIMRQKVGDQQLGA
jgi:hypothetical protein